MCLASHTGVLLRAHWPYAQLISCSLNEASCARLYVRSPHISTTLYLLLGTYYSVLTTRYLLLGTYNALTVHELCLHYLFSLHVRHTVHVLLFRRLPPHPSRHVFKSAARRAVPSPRITLGCAKRTWGAADPSQKEFMCKSRRSKLAQRAR